jgi:hypothetical protein
MSLIQEFEEAVLVIDLAEYNLMAGDMGTIVDIDKTGQQVTVEFFALDGTTIAVVPMSIQAVRPVSSQEIAHARALR